MYDIKLSVKRDKPPNLEKSYDIYLAVGHDRSPDLSGLEAKAPVGLDAVLEKFRGVQWPGPGFLGLELPAHVAAEILELLNEVGASGLVVPVPYRQPKVSREMARPIAEEAIAQTQKELCPGYTFEPVQFLREGAMWWDFGAVSEDLAREGYAPGRIDARVDKLDGHLWSQKEQATLYREEYYLEMATIREPMQVLKLLSERLGFEWGVNDKKIEKELPQPYLKASPALAIAAVKETLPPMLQDRLIGIRATVRVWFRIKPYKKGYDSARELLHRAVYALLDSDPGDAVLLFDGGSLVKVCDRIAGEMKMYGEF